MYPRLILEDLAQRAAAHREEAAERGGRVRRALTVTNLVGVAALLVLTVVQALDLATRWGEVPPLTVVGTCAAAVALCCGVGLHVAMSRDQLSRHAEEEGKAAVLARACALQAEAEASLGTAGAFAESPGRGGGLLEQLLAVFPLLATADEPMGQLLTPVSAHRGQGERAGSQGTRSPLGSDVPGYGAYDPWYRPGGRAPEGLVEAAMNADAYPAQAPRRQSRDSHLVQEQYHRILTLMAEEAHQGASRKQGG